MEIRENFIFGLGLVFKLELIQNYLIDDVILWNSVFMTCANYEYDFFRMYFLIHPQFHLNCEIDSTFRDFDMSHQHMIKY